jgi:hypothetical protein
MMDTNIQPKPPKPKARYIRTYHPRPVWVVQGYGCCIVSPKLEQAYAGWLRAFAAKGAKQ